MAKLYYGNGNCSIEGSDIQGVQIRYRGNIIIDDKTPNNFALVARNKGILIFPVGATGSLDELFDYRGEFKIVSVKVSNNSGENVPTTIHKVMDYSELLTSNAEDLTVKSEDLKSTHISGELHTKTTMVKKVLPNLQTSNNTTAFYLADGREYTGDYHIHLKDNNAMTGKEHTEYSKDLYFKQVKDGEIIDKLIPTKNPSHVPPIHKLNRISKSNIKRRRSVQINNKAVKQRASKGGY